MDGDMCLRQAYDAIYQGDFESAVYWFGRAIELDPGNAAYYHRASITCARSGKLQLAMDYALKALELNPDEPSYRLNLRMIQSKQRIAEVRQLLSQPTPDIASCIALMREAVQLDPLSAEANLVLGVLYRMQQNYSQALGFLRDALQLEPGLEEAKRLMSEIRAERRRVIKQQYKIYHTKRKR
ncbi:tetratricopeptide repeat protein [Cohnella terricola]|nr:tetratricopeptide repeat protein [Cohnella terricola]